MLAGVLAACCGPADAAYDVLDTYTDPSCAPASLVTRVIVDVSNPFECKDMACEDAEGGDPNQWFITQCNVETYPPHLPDTVVRLAYSGATCTGEPIRLDLWPRERCLTLPTIVTATCNATHAVITSCAGPSCFQGHCLVQEATLGSCGAVGLSGVSYLCSPESTPPCTTAAYTTAAEAAGVFWQVGGNALDADPVSATKDCLALAADSTVYGGWTAPTTPRAYV